MDYCLYLLLCFILTKYNNFILNNHIVITLLPHADKPIS